MFITYSHSNLFFVLLFIYCLSTTCNTNGIAYAATLPSTSSEPKDCVPFFCVFDGLDEQCKIRNETNPTSSKLTTCRHFMKNVCNDVIHTEKSFLEKCKHHLHNKTECGVCKRASTLCHSIEKTLISNGEVSRFSSNSLLFQNISTLRYLYMKSFFYLGGGRCFYCDPDNIDA